MWTPLKWNKVSANLHTKVYNSNKNKKTMIIFFIPHIYYEKYVLSVFQMFDIKPPLASAMI